MKNMKNLDSTDTEKENENTSSQKILKDQIINNTENFTFNRFVTKKNNYLNSIEKNSLKTNIKVSNDTIIEEEEKISYNKTTQKISYNSKTSNEKRMNIVNILEKKNNNNNNTNNNYNTNNNNKVKKRVKLKKKFLDIIDVESYKSYNAKLYYSDLELIEIKRNYKSFCKEICNIY